METWRFIKYEWIEFEVYKSMIHLINCIENMLQNFREKFKNYFWLDTYNVGIERFQS